MKIFKKLKYIWIIILFALIALCTVVTTVIILTNFSTKAPLEEQISPTSSIKDEESSGKVVSSGKAASGDNKNDNKNKMETSEPDAANKAIEGIKFKDMDTLISKTFTESGKHYIGIKSLKDGETFISLSEKTPSASVIKIYIMLTVYDKIKKGELSEDSEAYGSTIKSLVNSMITVSDNAATNKLITKLSMDEINKTIQAFSFKDTILERKMLDYEAKSKKLDNYTSVRDTMRFFELLYKNELLGAPYDSIMLSYLQNQQVRTKIPLLLPKATKTANKTGELEDVENDCGIVYTNNGDFIICVFTSNVKNTAKTREAIANLAKTAYNLITKQTE